MSEAPNRAPAAVRALLWVARLAGIAAVLPLVLIVLGESGSGPSGVREWVYLAFFPFGFSIGYLAGWRWPLFGGSLSLACMVASLLVIGRGYEPSAYLIWAVLSVPGALFVVAGWLLRRRSAAGRPTTA